MIRLILIIFLFSSTSFAVIEDFNEVLDRAEFEHHEVARKQEETRQVDEAKSPNKDKTIRIMNEGGEEKAVYQELAIRKHKHKKRHPSGSKNGLKAKHSKKKIAHVEKSKSHKGKIKNRKESRKPSMMKKEKRSKREQSAVLAGSRL